MKCANDTQTLKIENCSPAELRQNPQNPRAHKPPQVAAIARSIETFGFNVPILVDGENMIIAGHGRVLAALKLGLATVPVIRIDNLSAEQRKAYMIADNRLTDISRWDDRLLGEVLRDLTLADLSFDIETIGFSVGEIDLRIENLDLPKTDSEDILPDRGPAVTKLGDLWALGRHRLLCGNALDASAWETLMAGQKAAMTFTDPPYNVRIANNVSGLGRVRHGEFAMASGEMDRDTFTAFLADMFKLVKAHSTAGSLAYVCMDWRHIGEMMDAGDAAFSELKNLCIWTKPAGAMGALYRSQYELVFVWKTSRGRHRNNVELGRHGRNRSNVWAYPGIAGFRYSEGGDLLADHPSCKPVRLVADAILDVTARGDPVVDPFLGSGTTLIAAERVGRTAYGLELDPGFCDTILRRYMSLTGDVPIHCATGRSFAEFEAASAEEAA